MTPLSSADSLQQALIDACTRPRVISELASEWDIDAKLLENHVTHLVSIGVLARVGDARIVVPSEETGVGYISSSGVGRYNVIPDDANLPLMKVRPEFINDALVGDRVLFHVVRRSKGKQYGALNVSARVMAVIKERPTNVVGVYEHSHTTRGNLRLQGRDKPRQCVVVDGPSDLRPGQLVRVNLARDPGPRGFEGDFVEIVADIEAADDDTISVCALMDLPLTFPEVVIEAAKRLPKDPSAEDFAGRLDLRDLLTITIDPADAKDHDDAVSVEELGQGLIRVGVHIADVSHYVTPDSVFDIEAYERGTSTYLPGHTVPMLPHELSAELCSLKEGVDRLAKSCFFVVAKDGSILRREIYKSIIRVDRFFNYEEVFTFFEGENEIEAPFAAMLKIARAASSRLRERRMNQGSVMLSIDRPHLRIGNEGEVVEVTSDRQNSAHHLIEDFMLAANRSVARFMLERNMPYICRQHPSPSPNSEDEFAEFCEELGVAAPSFQDPRAIQLFLDGLEGLEGKAAIHLAVLKSMMRASYEDKKGLHYALGFYEYTHFTSPIRRLCDLTVHQILDRYFEAGGILKRAIGDLDHHWVDGKDAHDLGKEVDGARIRDAGALRIMLKSIAQRANETERRSSKAEMRAIQLKLLRTMVNRIGERFQATVVHITTSGIIFQLDDNMVEGSIFFRDLCEAWVKPEKFWVAYPGRNGETHIRVGDRMEVEVAQVDLSSQLMRLVVPGTGTTTKSSEFVDYRKGGGGKGRGKPGFRSAKGTGAKPKARKGGSSSKTHAGPKKVGKKVAKKGSKKSAKKSGKKPHRGQR